MEKLIEILNTDINKKIKSKFLLKFFTEFSVLLDAGLPILYSLDNIRTKNKKERDFVRRIYNRLNEGMSLFTAFSYEDIENKEYILAMLESAELGSPLNEVLSEIKDYLKIKLEKMSKTKSKLIYPIILFVTSILVSFFLILKVLPSFSQMYESMGTDLPTSTKIMISISDFLINNWVYILLAPILLVLLIFIFNRTSKTLRLINHKLIYNFPIYGNIITIRLCYNYSFIIKNLAKRDINILKIIDCLRSLSKNSYLEEKLLNIKDDLTRGESLSKSFEKIEFLPSIFIEMLGVADRSGKLDSVMEKSYIYYETIYLSYLERLITILEPVLIIFMAGLVGFIVISVATPMFNLIDYVNY